MILHTQTPVVDETDGLPLPHRIWAVVGISFALCMSVLDINIINVVLPTLSHDFGTSPAVTTWIINGYQLAIVISLLSFSSLGEIYGYRKIFLSGIAMFIVTSLICALSHSFWTLTIARIFQGFSASAITSVNTAQLRTIYPRKQIGRGMGINAMVVAISAAAGPSVASGILSVASWHWLFAINVPLGLVALTLGLKYLPRKEERSNRKFDKLSAIANAITFGLLIYTLDGFAHHENNDYIAIQLAVLAVVGTYYVRRQLNQPSPLLSPRPVGNSHFQAFHSYQYLFVHRSNAGNGLFTLLPAKLFGIQRGHDRAIVNSLAYSHTGDSTGSRISGGTHSSRHTGQHRDGIVLYRTLLSVYINGGFIGHWHHPAIDALWCRFWSFPDTEQQYNHLFRPYPTFGRSQRNVGYGTALGTDIRYDTGCFALQFCSTREEYGGLSDSRQRICVCRSSGKQHAAFTTLHIKDEAPITISIHVYRPTGSQSNTK